MDLYRLDSLNEVVDLGLDDYFLGEGVCVVEWADKGTEAFVGDNLNVQIQHNGDQSRVLKVRADSPRYSGIIDALTKRFGRLADANEFESTQGGAN